VNEITIENLSDQEVFIQAGELVRGGKQDRTIPADIVLKPRSGKVPLKVFCVEAGRWSGRGQEPTAIFSYSSNFLPNNDLRLAALYHEKQIEVWNCVKGVQLCLRKNVSGEVFSAESPTSLELTLETEDVKKAVEEYIKALEPVINKEPFILGYVAEINGSLVEAQVYGSGSLFRKLWPKLLKATAVQALTVPKKKAAAKTSTHSSKEILNWIKTEGTKVVKTKKIAEKFLYVVLERKDAVIVELRVPGAGDAFLHRNVIRKS